MSFFEEEGDDSNLQYDDAAFMYFIASTLIVAASIIFVLILRDLLSLRIKDRKKIAQSKFLLKQIDNLASFRRREVFTSGFLVKIAVLIGLLALTAWVYTESRTAENKMKGFDPFEILGLQKGATLREVKKAYRKLALEFHPDKNIGNPDAQAKFILISKSYECFTDESKRDNCFKYGSPDGASSFRVGIGLPKLFINVEYKWYVLPIVLSIILIIIPFAFMKWSNKTFTTDPNGISIQSYKTLFRSINAPMNKYSAICFLASYKELYHDLGYGPISKQNKERFEAELTKYPQLKQQMEEFSDNQLYIAWEIFKYCAGIQEFTHPEFYVELEKFIEATYHSAKLFAMKVNDGVRILGNPEWTVKFMGTVIVETVCAFTRDYYNRCLTYPNTGNMWLHNISLSPQEMKIAQANPVGSIYNLLRTNQIDQYLTIFPEARRAQLKGQMQNLPVYCCEYKILIDGQQVKQITSFDFPEVKYRVSRTRISNGYCSLSKYPYPKVESVYLLVVLDGSLLRFKKIEFKDKNYYIGKVAFRWGEVGKVPMKLYFISDSYTGLDITCDVDLNAVQVTPEMQNRKIEFHSEDINIEKNNKNFFEELLTLELDPEENQLSDSQE